jgi:hypothetical protein
VTGLRVYIPTTLEQLREVIGTGGIGPAPLAAFAVTGPLREWYLDDDAESLEYAALTGAARLALSRLAEVPDSQVRADQDGPPGAALVDEVVATRAFEAVHVDLESSVEDVNAAVESLAPALAGDDDAQFVVDSVEDHELAWFAVQELPDLLS